MIIDFIDDIMLYIEIAIWRGRIVAECVRLESGYTARYRGFDSLPLRKIKILILQDFFSNNYRKD